MQPAVALLAAWRTVLGIASRVRWLWPQLLKLVLAIASTTFAVVFFTAPEGGVRAFLADPSNASIVFELIAFFTLVWSALVFWSTVRVSLVLDPLPALQPEALARAPGEEMAALNGQAILYRPAVNRALEAASNPIAYNPRRFEVHPLIQEMLPSFLMAMPGAGWDTRDDAKVRLCSDLTEELLRHGAPVGLQRTSYFCDRLSNTLANHVVRLHGRELLRLRREAVTKGRLTDLVTSRLSNQLGGSVILVTADGIVYLRQGNRTDENPGRLAPAGSGSFDLPADAAWHRASFQDYARAETLRELCEECGLPPAAIRAIQLCGYGRYLYRCGKPEVFCIAVTDRRSNEVVVPVKEWDYQQREVQTVAVESPVGAPTVAAALDRLLGCLERGDEGFENASGPLYWNVMFARDYLLQIDDAARRRLFGTP